MMRRLFFRRATAAVAVAPMMLGEANTMRDLVPPSRYTINAVKDATNIGAKSLMSMIPRPIGLDKYHTELNIAERTSSYLYNLRDINRNKEYEINPNILALKSVSNVNKIHMEINRRRRLREEETTFREWLMDKFGVRDYFKRVRESDIGGPVQDSGRNY